MADLRTNLAVYFKGNTTRLKALGFRLMRVVSVVFAAYLVASTLAAAALGFLSSDTSGKRSRVQEVMRPDTRKQLNFRDVRKSVVARNIFNSDGEVPDEADPSETETETGGVFDKNAKCQKSSLPIELVGTIYAGNESDSLATVREKGYSEADVYRVGDQIIGNEQATVYAIDLRRLILNNNGVKECIELEENQRGSSFSPSVASRTPSSSTDNEPPMDDRPSEGGGSTVLDSAYVEESLGPGFAKILDSGRLVPYHKDNAMVGFKLIGAKSDSLWKKVGLNSGDVITSVNGTSMAEPDKGFAIFEALQNEREIRVEYLKSGKSPANISVEIR